LNIIGIIQPLHDLEANLATAVLAPSRQPTALHNTNISVCHLKQDDRPPVEALLNAVAGTNADLLVMGGYGHGRLREVIFGGFARRVLNGASLPILMAH
jgi:nucleotide-binding universal stress UspA family protein